MCLAIPAQVVSIDGNTAIVDFGGVKRTVSIALLEKINPGDYVIVHAGFAINKINEEHALESLQLLREAASVIFGDQKEETDG